MKLSDDAKIVIVLTVLTVCYVSSLLFVETNVVVKYDCRLAEISVDYPQAVKTQCRELLRK